MPISPYAALDAGIPTDADNVGNEPDKEGKTDKTHRSIAQRMTTDLRYVYAETGVVPDKIEAAECLTRLGYAAADIIEHIDDAWGEGGL